MSAPNGIRCMAKLLSFPAHAPPSRLRFGRFELQISEQRLLVDGEPAPLRARALELLIVLVQRAGHLVTRQELLDLVWPGLVVEENNLSVQINALRKVLGSEIVATIPGRGYRFTAPLESGPAQANDGPPPTLFAPLGGPHAKRQVWGSSQAPTPLSLVSKLKTNLPVLLPPLIGRSVELSGLAALVDRRPLVTLLGAGGMGKTRLAQALLHQRLAHYEHGVCFIDLAVLARGDAVVSAVAAALGLPQPGGSAPLATLVNALAPLELLIGLDNAEHVVDAVAELASALLLGAPRARLLVTSQAPLKVGEESLYRLEPLALPPADAGAEAALLFGAVALFAQRAQALDRRFEVGAANVAQVVTLCRLLDGAPLAIELAAARLPQLGLEQLVSALHQRLSLLTQGRRDAPLRQQTLRATLEWSHGLLSPTEQTVFRRLSVFVGSASLALAQEVLADDASGGLAQLDPWAVLDALGALVDRSLVDLVEGPGGPDDLPRYRQLNSARLFAGEQLLAADESAALARRHAQALRTLLEQGRTELYAGRLLFQAWQTELDPDVDNGLAALQWALAHDDRACALSIAPVLSRNMTGRRHAECKSLWEQVEPLLGAPASEPPLPPALLARAVRECARVWSNTQVGRAQALGRQAYELAVAAGDTQTRYLALEQLAWAAGASNEIDSYRGLIEELLGVEDRGWSSFVQAEGSWARLWEFMLTDDLPGGLAELQRHACLLRAAGMSDEPQQANAIPMLVAAGRFDEAIRTGEALIEGSAGARNRGGQRHFHVLNHLTRAYLAKDLTAPARACAAEFWSAAQRYDMQAYWADCAALLAALEQRPSVALHLLGYADAAFAAAGTPRQSAEQRLVERAERLAAQTLAAASHDSEVARFKAQGARLQDADLAALALADAPSRPASAQ
ncbi:MAG: helix-turn-helix transcriptional regulator [Burkholderiaceae bacterium]|nr:helix-turn-helix transcriptional regulator [Burkholderiaceae bacterium]